jgi:hypothetical protein
MNEVAEIIHTITDQKRTLWDDLSQHDCLRCTDSTGHWYEVPGWLIWGCRGCNYQELHAVNNQSELDPRG